MADRRRTRTVRVLRNGQITLPKEFRDRLGLVDDDLLEISLEQPATLRLTPFRSGAHGSPWLKELYDVFAPVRESFARSGMTEAQINAELDAAVAEMRTEKRPRRRSAS